MDLVSLLQYLLPGFLAAWIFYGFTSHPKPSQFDQVVQALIFTLIVQAGIFCLQKVVSVIGSFWTIGQWNEQSTLLASIFSAVIVGFLFAYFSNNDRIHAFARKLGITKETSFPSEWFGVFSKKVTFVVLHLNDERRIYGWPREWPSDPVRGHFSLEQASWLAEGAETPLTGVDSVLIKALDVRWVEFMEKTWERQDGKEDT